MTRTRSPRLPFVILEALGADPALVGDIAEEFDVRRSRTWLWRQVLGAAPALLLGRTQQAQPHQWKPVNLAATPRGSAVGGLGLLTIVLLMIVVAPGSLVVVAGAAAAGVVLGAVLIVARRQRMRRPPRDPRTLRL